MFLHVENLELKKRLLLKLNEATDSSGASGSYRIPLSPGMRLWDKDILEPFVVKVSKYDDAELAYDSYDGQMSTPKKEIKKNLDLAKYIKL